MRCVLECQVRAVMSDVTLLPSWVSETATHTTPHQQIHGRMQITVCTLVQKPCYQLLDRRCRVTRSEMRRARC